MPRLKPHKRSEIINMHKAKVPLKGILRNTRCCLATVKNTVRKTELRCYDHRGTRYHRYLVRAFIKSQGGPCKP